LTGGLWSERVSGAIQADDRRTDRKVVLVVDDEAMVRILAVDLFEELGCEVLEAANSVEALATLEERPDVSLMFTDCRMPGMSGPELAKWPPGAGRHCGSCSSPGITTCKSQASR
jgi:PleD family two-component response regulator